MSLEQLVERPKAYPEIVLAIGRGRRPAGARHLAGALGQVSAAVVGEAVGAAARRADLDWAAAVRRLLRATGFQNPFASGVECDLLNGIPAASDAVLITRILAAELA